MLLPILCLAFHRVCLPLVYSYFVSTHCTPYAWLLLSILSFSCLACRPQFTTLFPQANHPARVQDDRQRIGQTPFRIHEMAKIEEYGCQTVCYWWWSQLGSLTNTTSLPPPLNVTKDIINEERGRALSSNGTWPPTIIQLHMWFAFQDTQVFTTMPKPS